MPSLPKPLIDPQELARRNNEARQAVPARVNRSRKLRKLLRNLSTPTRPIRAVGFFLPERKVGFHDSTG